MIEIILVTIAVVLFFGLFWIGILSAIIVSFFKWNYSYFKNYCFNLAGSIDQTGGVVMSPLFNIILIKQSSLDKFGNEDEKISSVLGKNKLKNKLTFTGRFLDGILEILDKNHTIKSIDMSKKKEKKELTNKDRIEILEKQLVELNQAASETRGALKLLYSMEKEKQGVVK